MRYVLALIALCLAFSPAEARHRHHVHMVQPCVFFCPVQAPHLKYRLKPVRRPLVRYSHHHVPTYRGEYLPHPEGCPRVAFCGCGAAVETLGKPIRRLWLVLNWYAFPRVQPSSGMVAIHPHHAMVLRHHIEGTVWMVADYNSGGHLSRLHPRDIRGWTIVNPR